MLIKACKTILDTIHLGDMTAIHTKNKNTRNLFRAVPAKAKHDSVHDYTSLEGRKLIDNGWKNFWKKRGFDKPPRVSNQHLGEFDLPQHTCKMRETK